MISPSGGDDTPIIQAALNAKGYAELDTGSFNVSALNMTGAQGLALVGHGLKTMLVPTASGANVIDCTGSSSNLLRDFRILGYGSSVHPNAGILAAQMQGSQASDVLQIENVRVDGTFGVAALYCLQVQSSKISGSQFYQYGAGMTATFTGNNFFGETSAFQTINNANNLWPSDWTVLQSEFHNMGGGWAMWIGGADSLRFYGGNMASANNDGVTSVNAVTINGVSVYPKNIIMDGTTFYSDSGVQPQRAVQGYTAAVTFRANTASMPLT